MLNGSLDNTKIVSEYNQEKLQSQTADKPIAPRGRATQLSRKNQEQGGQARGLPGWVHGHYEPVIGHHR